VKSSSIWPPDPGRHSEIVGRLRSGEPLAADQKVVLLAVAAEHGVILEDEAAARSATRLLVVISGAQPAQSAPYDDQVELLACIDHRDRLVLAVAQLVTGLHHHPRVAVRPGIVADPGVPGVLVSSGGRRRHLQ
jgi:hypothetical protein